MILSLLVVYGSVLTDWLRLQGQRTRRLRIQQPVIVAAALDDEEYGDGYSLE